MLVPNQIIETRWHPRNKLHLESKGYQYTHTGDVVFVKLEDMMIGSKCKVKVVCDYCGKEIIKTYKDYFAQKHYGKDSCFDCAKNVRAITNQDRYGGNSPSCSSEVRQKQVDTFIKKYGVPNPFMLDFVKEKAKNTNIKKYGVESPMQLPEIKEKLRNSLTKNGTCPTSKAQIKIYEMLCEIYGCENVSLNKPFGSLSLDCCLNVNDIIIDVEYDGWYWHKDRVEMDRRRNYYLIRKDVKVLRIRSNWEMPTIQQIKEAISQLVTTDKMLKYIDLDI